MRERIIVGMLLAICLIFTSCKSDNLETDNNSRYQEGVEAVESAIMDGKYSDSDVVGTPDDFPQEYNFGDGKISCWSRDIMLRKCRCLMIMKQL